MRAWASIIVLALLAGGCGQAAVGVNTRPSPTVTVLPEGAEIPAKLPEVKAPCDATETFRPNSPPKPPSQLGPADAVTQILKRGKLVVGIGASGHRLAYRDPYTGEVDGFEAEIVYEIAAAIFGTQDKKKVQFRTLDTADRVPAVVGRDDAGKPVEQVDMVIAAMTITCEREAKGVEFSADYYPARQKLLVHKRSGLDSIKDFAGKRICASKTSTNLLPIAGANSKPIAVAAANTSDCLLMLQQGAIAAVSTGDIILAGLSAQDPATEILPEPISGDIESTGIAMAKPNVELVRLVNGVLERLKSSGKWTQLQVKWLADKIGDAEPPVARYKPE